ncbi:MAG: glycoside hydrolase family 15 protein, partial [Alphaproteobacteria bacterium]
TGLTKRRAGFRQTVRPAKGSVLAAPITADTPPDYFFHWLRDASVVMDAALVLIRQGGETADIWTRHFEDYVDFSLKLWELNGSAFLPQLTSIRASTEPDLTQYIRPDAEIAAIDSDSVAGDVRFNANGTLDFLKWNRPQHDGVATRALGAMNFWDMGVSSSSEARTRLAALIRADLDYTEQHAGEPCVDIWEEEHALHYYTVLVQFAALQEGVRWMEMQDEEEQAIYLKARAAPLLAMLDGFWSPETGIYRSRLFPDGRPSSKDTDMSVILGVLHAGMLEGPHNVDDPKVLATLSAAEDYFAEALSINAKGQAEAYKGAAFGRYRGDAYFNGGAWFPCTFAAAEFHYRLAASAKASADSISVAEHLAKGDAIMEHARQFIPASGELTEQFDRDTGASLSAHDLSWSYAAFLTAWEAREASV